MINSFMLLRILGLTLLLTACGNNDTLTIEQDNASPSSQKECTGQCANNLTFLTQQDVEIILAQAIAEAVARDQAATIAITDRVGNVLAVFRMNNAEQFVTISSTAITDQDASNLQVPTGIDGGLEQINIIPDTMAAIAKAITAAYVSSEGNAFTTRTASQIVQQNFNPGEQNTPSGPLFGVQFSQLPCSDFALRFDEQQFPSAGPHRSPLGLSADPGGIPLYKNGTPVGGIGVISDGIYGLDKKITNFDQDPDELIALAGTAGFTAPLSRRADRITIVGKTARFSDATFSDLLTLNTADSLTDYRTSQGDLVAVPGYFNGGLTDLDASLNAQRQVIAGLAFGEANSGIIAADPSVFIDNAGQSLDAFVFADKENKNRYPAQDAQDTPAGQIQNKLTAEEVQLLLNQALLVANQARAQIRQPNGSQARVSVSIVDTQGTILAMGRTRDAPVFGADVSLQKARTAVFFSRTATGLPSPATQLSALPAPNYLTAAPKPIDLSGGIPFLDKPNPEFINYVSALQNFLGVQALESTGPAAAFSDRSGGNLSRPNYPDGPVVGVQGPLSKPLEEWSIFNIGLQLDLVYNALIQHVAFVLGAAPDVGLNCTGIVGLNSENALSHPNAIAGLANGIQIFPGSVPIYRNEVLIGGIGVSGDGVDQDDMIAFLAVHNTGKIVNNGLQNAPKAIRADKIDIPGQDTRLRYINCPQAPFIDSTISEVCNGK